MAVAWDEKNKKKGTNFSYIVHIGTDRAAAFCRKHGLHGFLKRPQFLHVLLVVEEIRATYSTSVLIRRYLRGVIISLSSRFIRKQVLPESSFVWQVGLSRGVTVSVSDICRGWIVE